MLSPEFLNPVRVGMTPRGDGGHDLLVASDPDDFAAESNSMASPLRKIIAATRAARSFRKNSPSFTMRPDLHAP